MKDQRWLFAWVMTVTLAIDQIVKYLCRANMVEHQSLHLPIPGVFEIVLVFNRGIAFGISQGSALLVTPIAMIMGGYAIYHVMTHPNESKWNLVTFGLLTSGALGNFYDRIRFHQVTDMFYFRAINFPVFNIADVCISLAGAMVIGHAIFAKKPITAVLENEKSPDPESV